MTESSGFLGYVFNTVYVLGGLAVLTATLLYFNQNSILYIPYPPGIPRTPRENPPHNRSPEEYAEKYGIDFEEHFIETPDGEKIHTWLLMQRENSHKKPTLIYFHGNAGNMGFRLSNAVEFFREGINVLMMDYRGYGSSSGAPTEEGLNVDADAVLDFARKHSRLDSTKIMAFGRSLGGAVAFSLAHRRGSDVAAVIVENTFVSVSAMVDHLMPVFRPIKSLVLRIKWDNGQLISGIKQPILFISGALDELVPPTHMRQLYDNAVQSVAKDFYLVQRGTHNDTWLRGGAAYYMRIAEFVAKNVMRIEGREEDYCHVSAEDVEEAKILQSESYIPTMRTDLSVN